MIAGEKNAKLWLFQVFALTAGLYGCQVWTTFSLKYDSSSKIIPTHVLHLASCNDSWVSRKMILILTACSAKQNRCPFFWAVQIIRFWNKSCAGWPYSCKATEVIHRLIRFCKRFTIPLCLSSFWMPYDLTSLSIWNSMNSLCAKINSIGDWKKLDNLAPHETHNSSRIMRTYHTHYDVPLGIVSGFRFDTNMRVSGTGSISIQINHRYYINNQSSNS